MSDVLELKKKLNRHLKMELELQVTENRSTMLNILERNKHFARLSIHKMFLKAPDEVVGAVAGFIRGSKEKREGKLKIRSFIQKNLEHLDYSADLDRSKFSLKGVHYDLKEIYDELNQHYFNNRLNLAITWYGVAKKVSSKLTFGQYLDQFKLVKIHRILDNLFFPPFFVSFVVYHEMLHHVVPGYVDHNGLYRTHGPEFKKQEALFKDYRRAILWEKKHKEDFFNLHRPLKRSLLKNIKERFCS